MEIGFISPKASSDILKLQQGADRIEVALDALQESLLTPQQFERLKTLLKTASQRGIKPPSSSNAAQEYKPLPRHGVIEGKVSVDGQHLDTFLARATFGKSRDEQKAYAAKFGYRLATRKENRAFVESLLSKESDGTISAAEKRSLKMYYTEALRDAQGALFVDERNRIRVEQTDNSGHSYVGALLVKSSAESNSKSLDHLEQMAQSAPHQVPQVLIDKLAQTIESGEGSSTFRLKCAAILGALKK
jgi:hypothetical protein